MPWFVGIDEAGYGPNLGPLVQSAVAIRCDGPPELLNQRLDCLLRRQHDPRDDRILMDDSKKVYSGPRGFQRLEVSVLGTIPLNLPDHSIEWVAWLRCVAADSLASIRDEPWFFGGLSLPVEAPPEVFAFARKQFRTAFTQNGLLDLHAHSVETTPAEFNRLLAQGLNKSQVLEVGLHRLFRYCQQHLIGADETYYFIDRQGGRRYYADFLRSVFSTRWVYPTVEDQHRSCYRCPREPMVEWTFLVQAESNHWLVAWASMLSKYTRELSMRQFNSYWQRYLPNLRATAGYPVDAQRFLSDIEETRRRLAIPVDFIWRRR